MLSNRSALVSDNICVGMEMEYEGVSWGTVSEAYSQLYSSQLLTFHDDGSLRPHDRNVEIKFRGPLSGQRILEAVEQIAVLARRHKHRVSWRCGMHVHVDCRGLDFTQPYRTLVLSALLEPLLFAWDRTGRQENKFCQSLVDSVYAYIPTANKPTLPILTKYAPVNLQSLFRLGTMEVRFAGATFDAARMLSFVNLGIGLREITTPFQSAEELVSSVLQARSVTRWLEDHAHPLLAGELIPITTNLGLDKVTPESMHAAMCLVQYESRIPRTIIG